MLALIAAYLQTKRVALSDKGIVTTSKYTYEQEGSFKLTLARDDYLTQTVTSTKIKRNESSGSGGFISSTHTGSSGRTHGGGGKGF